MNLHGYFGFLNDHLLEMIAYSGDKFRFITRDLLLINKYGFSSNGDSYRLVVEEDAGIRAFWLRTYCVYNNGTYFIESINVNENNTVYLFPNLETHIKLGLASMDDRVYGINQDDWKRDVEEIWQEREPIDGFIFDVAPKVYIKKKDEPYDEEKWERISETGADE